MFTTTRPSATTAPTLVSRPSFTSTVSAQLTRSGKWARWAGADPDVAWPASLEDAALEWRREKTEDAYRLVARLTWLGSRRGGDDNDAALGVLVLLDPGIRGLAA